MLRLFVIVLSLLFCSVAQAEVKVVVVDFYYDGGEDTKQDCLKDLLEEPGEESDNCFDPVFIGHIEFPVTLTDSGIEYTSFMKWTTDPIGFNSVTTIEEDEIEEYDAEEIAEGKPEEDALERERVDISVRVNLIQNIGYPPRVPRREDIIHVYAVIMEIEYEGGVEKKRDDRESAEIIAELSISPAGASVYSVPDRDHYNPESGILTVVSFKED